MVLRPGSFAALLIVGSALLLATLSGCPEPERTEQGIVAASGSQDDTTGNTTAGGYDFSPLETSAMIGNRMHQVHNEAGGIECSKCHAKEEWITHEEALALCDECHPDQVVAIQVWGNHCISCHQFTSFTETYADSDQALEELCIDCHGVDSVVHQAFAPGSSHDISCDNCHHPHETALVMAKDTCETCHPDVVEQTSEENRVHGSCTVCHTPHSELVRDETLCEECHFATSDILVHNVPEHPKNCLVCHDAHFTAVEVTNESCETCHEEMEFGESQETLPAEHRDCKSCHFVGNFEYLGDEQCTTCHADTRHVVESADMPEPHASCLTCHPPHSWYAEIEQNCVSCHELDSVIEHNLTFHQHDCMACHDPHSVDTMARSGDCEGCHGEDSFPGFTAGLADEHLQCANCHSRVAIDARTFKFAGPESCKQCHTVSNAETGRAWADVPPSHQLCTQCHAAHEFTIHPKAEDCMKCHQGLFTDIPAPEHEQCFNCHAPGHDAHFTGPRNSCDNCHPEPAAAAANDFKRDCIMCHVEHNFELPAVDCGTCHHGMADTLSAGHGDCADCHDDHNWQPDAATCKTCHTSLPQSHSGEGYTGCSECHPPHG
jgi:hypothetical protein